MRKGERFHPPSEIRASAITQEAGGKEKKTLVGKLPALLGSMEQRLGPLVVGITQKMSEWARGNIDQNEFSQYCDEVLEKNRPFGEFQEKALEYLEKLGIVSRESGMLIADLGKIKNLTSGVLNFGARRHGDYENAAKAVPANARRFARDTLKPFWDYYNGNVRDFLFNAFYGKEVVSKAEWEVWKQGEEKWESPEARPMFYSPKSEKGAFDIDAIKKANFHLGLWEVGGAVAHKAAYSPFHQGLSFGETVVACVVYSPRFGDARRGSDGRLMVRGKGGGRRKISWEWYKDAGGPHQAAGDPSVGAFSLSPKLALQEGKMPHLTKSGILLADDFEAGTTTEAARKFGVRKEIMNDKGMVVIESVRYTLGRKNASRSGAKKFVVKLSDKLGGILEGEAGSEELMLVFDLLDPKDPRLSKVITNNGATYYTARKEFINLRSVSKAEEKIFGIEEPKREAFDYKAWEKAKLDFAQGVDRRGLKTARADMDILSVREQVAFLDFFESSDENTKQKLYRLYDLYRRDGLRSFLALRDDPGAAEKIFDIFENFEAPLAKLIFQKYCEILDKAQEVESELGKFISIADESKKEMRPMLAHQMVRRAGQLLEKFAERAARKEWTAMGLKPFVVNLESIRSDVLLFANTFRLAFEKYGVDFAEINGVSLSRKDSGELNAHEKEEMTRIFVANRKVNAAAYPPEWMEQRKKEFGRLIDSPGKKFYLLYDGDNLLAFAHSEPKSEGRIYMGSLNVDPEARGQKIGSVFFQAVLDLEGRRKPVEILVNRLNTMFGHYIKDFGFEIEKIIPDYKGSGKDYAVLVRPPGVSSTRSETELAEAA